MKYRLILSDVDSTLINQEVIDLLATKVGKYREISLITEQAMSGKLNFASALRERISLLSGLSVSALDEVASQLTLSPGAQDLFDYCKDRGILFGAVSGGFIQVLSGLPFFKGLDYLCANNLEIHEGRLTGKIMDPIIDRAAKAEHLRAFAQSHNIAIEETIAIGDGANDIDMIKMAGLGVSFRGKAVLREQADLAIEDSLSEVIAAVEA